MPDATLNVIVQEEPLREGEPARSPTIISVIGPFFGDDAPLAYIDTHDLVSVEGMRWHIVPLIHPDEFKEKIDV
jgi:hypothetical protein